METNSKQPRTLSNPEYIQQLATQLGISDLQEPFRSALISSYAGAPQLGVDGATYQIDQSTRISPQQGMWIYNLCLQTRAQRTLEIGLAYGFSLVYLLAAGKANGIKQHIAIDPFQMDSWHGIGALKAREVGMADAFRLVQELSSLAVPALYKEGLRFDLIFIDGNHRFDDVLVDFTLCDLVCEVGGHIIFDDMWMPSIQKVVAFISQNRPDYARVATPVQNISVYRKLGPDQRDWQHFVNF